MKLTATLAALVSLAIPAGAIAKPKPKPKRLCEPHAIAVLADRPAKCRPYHAELVLRRVTLP